MHPNFHDSEQLASIYSHLDGSTTINLLAQDGAAPYRTERRDNRCTSKITERFADGSTRITFICWAIR